MKKWQEIKIDGIAKITKCVAEFDVMELKHTPYAKFKVKIFEDAAGNFTGFTNLMAKDALGSPVAGVGYGSTIEEALEDTIRYFLSMLNEKQNWTEDDFECSDPFDF
jgi:hypothetical protein